MHEVIMLVRIFSPANHQVCIYMEHEDVTLVRAGVFSINIQISQVSRDRILIACTSQVSSTR